jgi:rfaE bifunctional protein kinase chain/domain
MTIFDSFHLDPIISEIRGSTNLTDRIVFVSGIFNVIHPGHLRLLKFAKDCGNVLVVAVTKGDVPGTLIPEALRLDGVKAISFVDHAFLFEGTVENVIMRLKPSIVVKGKEFESCFNSELSTIDSYGGKLLFSSGETFFSSFDLLQKELNTLSTFAFNKSKDFTIRHGFNTTQLIAYLKKFSELNIVVIGDLIVDEYITCDPLGMSQEDATIVVTPIKADRFVGGSAIVASHAKALGAKVNYFSVVGMNENAIFALNTLQDQGINVCLIEDETRPTTLKQRFRARGKTLLRVSHLRQHEIRAELISKLKQEVASVLKNADLLVFSDFNYGVLPNNLVYEISALCKKNSIHMVADSQSSSQIGDISRFKDMLLITPTEHEARLAVRESGSSLTFLAKDLQKKSNAQNVFITLGSEGVFIHPTQKNSTDLVDDQLPAFNSMPKDVSGAGDCLLMCASMALVAGASSWESAYLGSVAAACQVGRVGNLPLTSEELIQELMR